MMRLIDKFFKIKFKIQECTDDLFQEDSEDDEEPSEKSGDEGGEDEISESSESKGNNQLLGEEPEGEDDKLKF